MRTGYSRRLPRFATAADFGRLLLLLMLVARAWVPVGYMPDAEALRQGRLALGFCAAGGGSLAMLQALAQRQSAGSGPDANRSPDSAMVDHGGARHAGREAHGDQGQGVHTSGDHASAVQAAGLQTSEMLGSAMHEAPAAHRSPAHVASDDVHHHNHHEQNGAGQECPFGLSAHQVLHVPPMAALAPVLLHWLALAAPPARHPRPPLPAAGPPLGQRAPPLVVE